MKRTLKHPINQAITGPILSPMWPPMLQPIYRPSPRIYLPISPRVSRPLSRSLFPAFPRSLPRPFSQPFSPTIAPRIFRLSFQPLSPPRSTSQRGFSLVIVLLILLITSLLSAGASQISLMGERSARSDRDQQVAWQSAEAALADAELEMNDKSSQRYALFDGKNAVAFVKDCGRSGQSLGLCAMVESGKPAWLTANFNSTANDAPTVPFGRFTGQKLQTGEFGVQPSKLPRYVIEILPDPTGDKTAKATPTFLYRVTAMGFGPRVNIQTVQQTTYRK